MTKEWKRLEESKNYYTNSKGELYNIRSRKLCKPRSGKNTDTYRIKCGEKLITISKDKIVAKYFNNKQCSIYNKRHNNYKVYDMVDGKEYEFNNAPELKKLIKTNINLYTCKISENDTSENIIKEKMFHDRYKVVINNENYAFRDDKEIKRRVAYNSEASNNGKKCSILLVNIHTLEEFEFKSFKDASLFIGHSPRYLTDMLYRIGMDNFKNKIISNKYRIAIVER